MPMVEGPRPWIRMVAIGDSLTAGMQDVCLDSRSAEMAYSKQLADRADIEFNMPHIDREGIPPLLFRANQVDLPGTIDHYGHAMAAAAIPLAWLNTIGIPPAIMLHPLYNSMGQRTAESLDTPQRPQSNFAVPGYEARHLDDAKSVKDYLREIRSHVSLPHQFTFLPPLMHAIIQNGKDKSLGSEVDQAIKQNPDLVLLWAGNNDALEAAVSGGIVDDVRLTPMEDRAWNYYDTNTKNGQLEMHTTKTVQKGYRRTMTDLIDRLEKETSAEVVMMTIPDVTVIPVLHKVGDKVGPLPFRIVLPDGSDVTHFFETLRIPSEIKGEGKNGRTEFPPGTCIGLATLMKKITEIIEPQNLAEFKQAMSAVKRSRAVFEESDVLDPDELHQISGRIDEYNTLLKDIAKSHPRVHIVDTHEILADAKNNGVALRGSGDAVTVTNTFTGSHDPRGYGGMFSFDGIHPSDVGHAVLANKVLERLQTDLAAPRSGGTVGNNDKFKPFLNVPFIDEREVYRNDPHQPSTPGSAVPQEPLKMVLSRATASALQRI